LRRHRYNKLSSSSSSSVVLLQYTAMSPGFFEKSLPRLSTRGDRPPSLNPLLPHIFHHIIHPPTFSSSHSSASFRVQNPDFLWAFHHCQILCGCRNLALIVQMISGAVKMLSPSVYFTLHSPILALDNNILRKIFLLTVQSHKSLYRLNVQVSFPYIRTTDKLSYPLYSLQPAPCENDPNCL